MCKIKCPIVMINLSPTLAHFQSDKSQFKITNANFGEKRTLVPDKTSMPFFA